MESGVTVWKKSAPAREETAHSAAVILCIYSVFGNLNNQENLKMADFSVEFGVEKEPQRSRQADIAVTSDRKNVSESQQTAARANTCSSYELQANRLTANLPFNTCILASSSLSAPLPTVTPVFSLAAVMLLQSVGVQ